MRLASLFHSRDVNRIAALQLLARQAVEGLAAGRHRSPHKGSSVEFKEHRPYVPGDELRNIDWAAYGKSDRLYIREFDEETNLRCTLLVDRSGSMNYGGTRAGVIAGIDADPAKTPPATKQTFATALAAAIAYLLLSSQDAVGLMTFDKSVVDILPPRSRTSHLRSILSLLAAPPAGGETDLGVVLRQAHAKLPRRGMVVLISDGLGDVETLGQSLAMLRAGRQDVLFLQVLDPDEFDFPFTDRIEFRDLELAGNREIVDARQLRDRYLESLTRHNAAIAAACKRHRIDHALLTTDLPLVDSLARFVRLRQSGGLPR